ncbi:MAG: hypothetical protein HUU22_02015 [Phycisphaerae bacterium]|nr:hypothetical protein [Phycisphaerae bacterium]
MTWQFDCPLCRLPVTAEPQWAGTRVRCTHCNGEFIVPNPDERPAAVAASPPLIRFTFTCQRCGSALEGNSQVSGKLGRCPTCGAVFRVPQVDPRTGLPTGPAVVEDDGELPTPMHAYAAAGEKAPLIRRRDNDELVIVCPRCDMESPVDANICGRCGLPFTMEGATTVAQQTGQAANSLASAAALVGIASFCVPFMGAVAIVMGATALLREVSKPVGGANTRPAIIGIVTGVVSCLIYVAAFVK